MWLLLALPLAAAFDFAGYQSIDLWNGATDKPSFTYYFKLNDTHSHFGAKVGVTDKWFGVGMTSSGGMIGADVHIFTPKDGKYSVGDYWSTAFSAPKLDDKQDLTLLHSGIEGGTTTVAWSRLINSCDQHEDLDILQHSKIVFAIGAGSELSYHGHRGNNVVDWKRGDITAQNEAALETDVVPLTMTPPNPIFLATDKTQYKCLTMPLNLTTDMHMVKREPIITSKFAHHMLFFACASDQVVYNKHSTVFGEPFDCSLMIPAGCIGAGGWAVGGKTTYVNKKYGLFIPKTAKTFFIQYHYDNYEKKPNMSDSSGVRIYLTPTLRPNHLGSMILSVPSQQKPVSEIAIPAQLKNYELTAEMPGSCTNKMVIDSTTITGVTFHMHQFGRYTYMEHWRGSKRLPDIGWQHWDFNFQTGIDFPEDQWVEFKKGDSLRLHCIYDTTEAIGTTLGGDGSDNEMCVAFVNVFPPPGVQIAADMPKTLSLLGMKDKVICIANPEDKDGLGGGSSTVNNGTVDGTSNTNLQTAPTPGMAEVLKNVVPKTIPSKVTGRYKELRCGETHAPTPGKLPIGSSAPRQAVAATALVTAILAAVSAF